MAVSRIGRAREAVRPSLKARMMLAGPPGAGKTRTSLIVAEVLAEGGKVLVIDTERESALTYADDFQFDHLPWEPPYDPRDLAVTLREAGDAYDVIVVDSLTHYWRYEGGTLDIAEGKFSGWKAARPAQDEMVRAILSCNAHVLVAVRSKLSYTQTVDERGRHVVEKLGMAPQQDDTLEYEMNISCEIGMEHQLTISKSRTIAVPVGTTFRPGHAAEMAETYLGWLKGGEPAASKVLVTGLLARMKALPERTRKECKAEFVASLGQPAHLRASQETAAEALVSAYEAQAPAEKAVSGPESASEIADGETPAA